jgi:xylulokinase
MAYLIGSDIGTSGAKSVIFDEKGKIVAQAVREYQYDSPKPGYAEQYPDVWWEAVSDSIREAMTISGAGKDEVAGIGLSGQMHGMVAMDKANRSIRKTILHCDVRAGKTAKDICESFGRERFYDITYNPVFSGFQLVSLLWLRENEPENFEKIASVICPKDYVRFRMTGELGVEATDASGTLAYDMKAQDWAVGLLGELGIPSSAFPPKISLSYEVAGKMTADSAEKCGLAAGTPVVFGGADQAMSSLGNGMFEKHVLVAAIGSSGQVLMLTDAPQKNPQMNTHIFRHVEPNVWYSLSGCLYGALALNWFSRAMAPDESYESLSSMAESIKPCSEGLAFFPALAGERSPHMDTKTRAAFIGVTNTHTKAHFVRAVMEGVTMEMKAGVEITERLYGTPTKIICTGGTTKSRVWRQIQADIYGQEIHISKTQEGGCLGAAILAGVGVGLFGSIKEGFGAMQKEKETIIVPIKENVEKYAEFYSELFSGIYPRNKELFHNSWKY